MEARCPYTEPTTLLPDRRELPQGVQAPPIRVDFILANEPFVRLINHGGSGGGGGVDAMTAEVILNNRTAEMSDHFPIRAQWTFPPAFF